MPCVPTVGCDHCGERIVLDHVVITSSAGEVVAVRATQTPQQARAEHECVDIVDQVSVPFTAPTSRRRPRHG